MQLYQLYQLFTMVDVDGTQICVHLHVSHLLYCCATDANTGDTGTFWDEFFQVIHINPGESYISC